MAEFRRILITGAAGSLGAHLRGGLAHLADRIRLLDAKGREVKHSTPRLDVKPFSGSKRLEVATRPAQR